MKLESLDRVLKEEMEEFLEEPLINEHLCIHFYCYMILLTHILVLFN